MEKAFSFILRKYRDDLRLTFEKLGNIAGLSKQYLHNLENHKLKRKLSFDKFKDVLVLLSQKEITISQEAFAEDAKKNKTSAKKGGRKKSGEGSPSYYDRNGLPSPDDLDLNKFKNLLFSSIGLSKYEDSFVAVESIHNTKTVIDEYIEFNKLGSIKITELKHKYEVWTLSEVLGETLFDDSAEQTAYYIINYKIKFVNFVRLDDNTQWKTAYQKVKLHIQKILENSNPEIMYYWQWTDQWENYFSFYGISKAAFFVRFRIYNPYSPNARGNYNVGGKTLNTAKLTKILQTEIPSIVDKLKLVIFTDESKLLDNGKDFMIQDLGCYVNKKIISLSI